ncbi:MAG TPA: serine/threonine-protein kinase [Thermoleophilaceae bacterium]|nr:serine/threonine-protein kinase [Thermoleophilaceae bacterium]
MAVGMTGRVLAGRYRTIRRLGSGGMATVWLAEDEKLRRQVAVKRLHGDVTDDDLVRRFQREARVGASLNHPNVVAVYDIAGDDEGVLIVMEYVEGGTLRDEIAAGPLPHERVLPILRGVADALDHAHGLGVLHRDVKPANVLLRKDGAVKLADLGIATAAEQSRITRSGAVLGTAAYLAPERLEGSDGDAAADVYALAAVAFEALSGRKPIEGTTPLEIAQRVVNQPPPDVRDVLPSAPAPVAAALTRGLAKDPAERPPTAGGLVTELERAFAAEPRPAPAPEPPTEATARMAPVAQQRATQQGARPPVAQQGARPPVARRSERRWPILAALILLATAALIAVLASGGDDSSDRKASNPAPAKSAKKKQRKDASAQAPATSAPPATAAPSQAPADTVNAFYQHAADHDYSSAWAMVTPEGRTQLGSESSFAAGQSTLRSISFPVLRTTQQTSDAATVQLQSRAVHTNRTDEVCGTVDLVRSGSSWLLNGFHLDTCKPAQVYPGGRKKGKFPKSPKPGKARGDTGAEGGD